MSWQKRV